MAWWDLYARSRVEPLWRTLGGKEPTVAVGADFGVLESLDTLLEKIDDAIAAGFERVKLKFAPGWDLDRVSAVRGAFPDAVFHIDCNSAYTLDDLAMFKQLDRYNLAMIEQPLAHDDLIDHAKLQKQIDTPICLDESITSPSRVRKAIEIGACRWINIKPVRMGGLTPAVETHDLCEQAGIPCWVGGMLESGLGSAHCLAMATLANIRYPSDIFPSSRFFEQDLVVPDIELSSPGRITARNAPGIGVEPDPERLKRFTVEEITLRS
jgi:O-succinylbenzoate synthase